MMGYALLLSLLGGAAAQYAYCAANHASCRESQCCQSHPAYTCYEKGVLYAECMPVGTCRARWPKPLSAGGSTEESDTGTCVELKPRYAAPPTAPTVFRGSSLCAANHANCFDSHCCQSPRLYSCYQKGEFYAACLPKGTCEALWPNSSCEVLKLPPPPPPPSPPPPPPHKQHEDALTPFVASGSEYCGDDHEDCSQYGCCRSPRRMKCYRKGPHYAACIPIGTCKELWGEEALCDELALPQPPPPPYKLSDHQEPEADEACTANHEDCSRTHCCLSHRAFACYEKGPHYAMCLKKGTCREHWPTPADGSCKLLAREREGEPAASGSNNLALLLLVIGSAAIGYGLWKQCCATSTIPIDFPDDGTGFDPEDDLELEHEMSKKKKKDKKERKKTKHGSKGEDIEMMIAAEDGEGKKRKEKKEKKARA